MKATKKIHLVEVDRGDKRTFRVAKLFNTIEYSIDQELTERTVSEICGASGWIVEISGGDRKP